LFNRRLRVLSPAARTKNLLVPLSRTNNCAPSLESEHESRLLKSGSYLGFDCWRIHFVVLAPARQVFGGVAGSAGAR